MIHHRRLALLVLVAVLSGPGAACRDRGTSEERAHASAPDTVDAARHAGDRPEETSRPGDGVLEGAPTSPHFQLEALIPDTDAAAVLDLTTGRLVATRRGEQLEVPRLPGSVFKLLAAATALEQGLDDPGFTCTGKLQVGGEPWRCWDPRGHGEVRLLKALALSCNLYFVDLATRLDPGVFLAQARRLGLGRPSGFAPGESVPALPVAMTREELMTAVLGDWDRMPATGYQLLRMAAVLSGAGPLAAPGQALDEVLREGMRQAASLGTATVKGAPIPYAAKTGSARPRGSWRIHGWCIGFAPAEDPAYAFVVYHPNGMGADAAGSAARIAAALPRITRGTPAKRLDEAQHWPSEEDRP